MDYPSDVLLMQMCKLGTKSFAGHRVALSKHNCAAVTTVLHFPFAPSSRIPDFGTSQASDPPNLRAQFLSAAPVSGMELAFGWRAADLCQHLRGVHLEI